MFNEASKEKFDDTKVEKGQTSTEFEPVSQVNEEVNEIEKVNLESWYMKYGENIPFIALSVTDVGPSREIESPQTPRIELVGNTSTKIGDPTLTPEQREEVGNKNVNKFIKAFGIKPSEVKIVYPQEPDTKNPLVMECADDFNVDPNIDSVQTMDKKADFVYTRNPNTVLAIKPADCPIIITKAETDKGPVLCYTHIPWKGAEAGHVENMFACYKELGIKPESIRIYISPGARKENFPYKFPKEQFSEFTHKDLFTDVVINPDGTISCNIDVSPVIRDTLHEYGIDDYQIFEDTSDTASQESGYSSHGRAARSGGKEINTRSLLIASLSSREFKTPEK